MPRNTSCPGIAWLCLALLGAVACAQEEIVEELYSPSDDVASYGDWVGGSSDLLYHTPGMIGDFFAGNRTALRGSVVIDRLFVAATDLDAPNPLPGANAVLSITEPGPVGVFIPPPSSTQQLQAFLRAAVVPPAPGIAGIIIANSTLTTTLTITEIQTLLASTPQAFDIIPVAAPPAAYTTGVNSAFQTRNAPFTGTTQYDGSTSGAMLQGGADTLTPGADLDAFYYYNYALAIDVNLPAAGTGGVGRAKLAEGGSPLPRNRVFFDYGHFQNVPYSPAGLTLDRYTFGFEKTFLDELASIEARFPFASGVDADVTTTGTAITNGGDTEFGDISLYLKTLLWEGCHYALSGGLGIVFPSADDITVSFPSGVELLRIDNEAVYLQPFLGFVTAHNRLFTQGFVQWDFDATGNSVNLNTNGTGLEFAGKLSDANHVFLDLGVGYWLYRNDCQCDAWLTGVAPVFEVHYTGEISDGEVISAGTLSVGDFGGELNMVNYVAGVTFVSGCGGNLSLAYTASLRDDDQQYDDGLRILYNYNYW